MKIRVVGKTRKTGTSKKTGNPYDFIELHYLGRAPKVIGEAALTLILDPTQYPYETITVPGDYSVDFDGKGYVVDFAPVPVSGK